MDIHYSSEEEKNYPYAICGKSGLAVRKTDDKELVTCSRCVQILEKRIDTI